MIKVKDEGVILERSEQEFENQAVLNPASIVKDGETHMFYRAVRKPDMVSTIGYCRLRGVKVINRSNKPILFPEHDYEKMGVEDPRIVLLDGIYYLFYTVYDGRNALFAYATSSDLVTFVKKGIISPQISYHTAAQLFGRSKTKVKEKYFIFDSFIRDRQGGDILLWEKDAFIFPKKINGRFALIHRVLPGIQVIYFDDFKDLTEDYWKEHLSNLGSHIVLDPEYRFESRNIGGGCPPIETKDGWLLIYHAVDDREPSKYKIGAMLLDLKDPTKVLYRPKKPLLEPTYLYENEGYKGGVAYPCGAVVKDDELFVYYGGADSVLCAATAKLNSLLDHIKYV